MVSEVESFIIDSKIKGYHIYKNVWSSFKCCSIAMMKEVEKGLSGRQPAAAKQPAETLSKVLIKIHKLSK